MELIFVLDGRTFEGRLIEVAREVAPFADKIWLRLKNEADLFIYETAVSLRRALPESFLILSARGDIALAAGFQGVHLGENHPSPQAVKSLFPSLLVGYSAHSAEECEEVTGADYYTLSPLFETAKKRPVLGPVDAPCQNVYALGGITCQTAPLLQGHGYKGAAGISLYNEIREVLAILKQIH